MSARPSWSASTTSAPSARSKSATVLLPLPSPPVSPPRSTGLKTPPHFSRAHGVGHQHGNSQRTHASGHRRIGAGLLKSFGIDITHNRRSALQKRGFALFVAGKVAFELRPLGNPVNADVDNRRPRPHHLRRNASSSADGC